MRITVFLLLLMNTQLCFGQSIDTVQFNHISEFEYIWTYSCYSVKFDAQQRPYLYTANNEMGIVAFDITDIQNPTPIDTLWPPAFGGLRPMNLWHEGNLLYAAVGGIAGLNPQDAGVAIMDVSDPHNITVLDVWSDPTYSEGGAIVIVDGDYAYLGAMDEGLIILNVSDLSNIQFESHLDLDPNFPGTPGIFSTPNARGMTIRNDTLLVCNDAGGLRMVDVTDKQNPVELSKYVNQYLDAVAQPAYNNALWVDDRAYIPVDYCGLDVVDVSDTSMQTVAWINPWNCDGASWYGNAGHTNEVIRAADNLIFVTGADTEVLAYDISDRDNPILVGEYANVGDSIVAWGVDANDQHVALALVDNSVFQQPYYSDFGGIMILEWSMVLGIDQPTASANTPIIYPNPTVSSFNIQMDGFAFIQVFDMYGSLVYNGHSSSSTSVSTEGWSRGVYLVQLDGNESRSTLKLVVQ